MAKFNFHNYQQLADNQVLKIKLINKDTFYFVKNVHKNIVQSYQPTFTPITKINLGIIKDIDLYMINKNNYENTYELRVEPEEIEYFELIDLTK